MTALFGLLPAALSTHIGSETQRPLAIVVVGGMTTTILLTRYLMPVLYSFYGHREPPPVPAAWHIERANCWGGGSGVDKRWHPRVSEV